MTFAAPGQMINACHDFKREASIMPVNLTLSTDVIKTEQPMRTKIMNPVTRCSRMPRNLGCSPGAEQPDSTFRLLTWEMERTVAATNHGRPIMEHTPSMIATTIKSR